MFYIWTGDIIYKNNTQSIYFDDDYEIKGEWKPVEKHINGQIKLLISCINEDK